MIPKKLKDWNEESILKLLEKGYYEELSFDFKKQLPHGNDEKGKLRIIKSCSAFSNSDGGFLVFGIKDEKEIKPRERMIGIDPVVDFPEHFGNYPQKCSPSVSWDFLNPPIKLENGNVIHVIEIHKSYNSPIGYLADNKWLFQKRTNKGNETMSYEDLKYGFLNFYEKRLKLNLIVSELININRFAKLMQIEEEKLESKYNIITFDVSIMQSLLSDSYSVIAEEKKLIANLQEIRNKCNFINKKVDLLTHFVELPLSKLSSRIKEHNKFINYQTKKLIPIVDESIALLESFLEK